MGKSQTIFVCNECGYETPKWIGKCPSCNNWNTLYEERIVKEKTGKEKKSITAETIKLNNVTTSNYARYKTGSEELDRVLGGGLVQGSLVLIGGEPGIGKSTLILQICNKIKLNGIVLYVSGEESASQIKIRAERLNINNDNIYFLGETSIQFIEEAIENIKPSLIIIDSIQTMYSEDLSAAPGSVSQVREITSKIMMICKRQNITTIIIGHVTKDGSIAGPRVLEHMVDTVLYIEGERYFSYRVLRGVKNRFGSTNEIGLFEMRDEGMVEITNPSSILISEREGDPSGSVIVVSMEGTRSMLIEIQALVCPSAFGLPRRTGIGIEYNRLVLLLAVLEKRAGYSLSNQDAYVNVVSGIKIDEPAVDLGIAMAVVSSFKNFGLSKDIVLIGEVGLTGEIRSVNFIEKRVKEAEKMGFKKCIIPESNRRNLKYKGNIHIIGVKNIKEAINACGM